VKSKESIDLISTFRKKIFFQFLAALVLAIVSLVLSFLLNLDNTFINEGSTVLMGMLFITTLYLFERKSELFQIIRNENDTIISEYEAYLKEVDEKEDKRSLTRLGLLLLVSFSMIFMIIVYPHSTWTAFVITLWLAFILMLIGMRWLLMNDHFFLQDLKRSLRVDHSEISE
jgi:cytochrome c biogenesis protein CcdA